MTNFWNQIEKQDSLHNLLESYGATFHGSLGNESEMSFTKSNGGGNVTTIVSYDVDLSDVMEEVKIEGLVITSSWSDNGFGTQLFPVTIIHFN